jgi:hypothetical protein
MRALLAIFGACFLIPGIAFSQKTDREHDGLKGPVKTVRVRQGTIVSESGKITETQPWLISMVSYDPAGNRTELALYDRSGSLSRRIAYEYDPETQKRCGLIVYNSQNLMLRKVTDKFGPNGLKVSSTLKDFNEDGTLFRRTEITIGMLGDIEVAEYNADGSLVKKDSSSLQESSSESRIPATAPIQLNQDQLVGYGGRAGEFFDVDGYGNWTRGNTASTVRIYASGNRVKTEDWMYREFAYY